MILHFANGGYIIEYSFSSKCVREIRTTKLNYEYITKKINSNFESEIWKNYQRLFFESPFTKFVIRVSMEEFDLWTREMRLNIWFEAREKGRILRPFKEEQECMKVKQKKLIFKYHPPIPWVIHRLIWIAKLKNNENTCVIARLPHDVIKLLMSFQFE